ncbi:calcium-dependent ARF-type GTPase activating protein family [Striga asiatica]|uniref:Calcium-dependent ARF-type GTPase activating protein family n=1 Tax=Striga asiatica TaxID=4170 RepID=A0A5A7R0Q6_STRAF|nr:calcium-dependent ARF-type GTPase activating protein family [Striga asiatica]
MLEISSQDELMEIKLIEGEAGKGTKVGRHLREDIQATFITMLREYSDIFAFSADDLIGQAHAKYRPMMKLLDETSGVWVGMGPTDVGGWGNDRGGRGDVVWVRDLLLSNDRAWNKNLILNLFSAKEAEEILKIQLDITESKDRFVWHWDNKGKFSVKSCYKALLFKKQQDKGTPESSNGAKFSINICKQLALEAINLGVNHEWLVNFPVRKRVEGENPDDAAEEEDNIGTRGVIMPPPLLPIFVIQFVNPGKKRMSSPLD